MDVPVGTAAGQQAPRRVEGNAGNFAALPLKRAAPPLEGAQQLAFGRVPKRYGAVEAASGELTEPRIEGDTLDRPVVPVERDTPIPGGTLAARGPPLLLGIAVSLAFSRWGPRDKIVNGSNLT